MGGGGEAGTKQNFLFPQFWGGPGGVWVEEMVTSVAYRVLEITSGAIQ